MCYLINRDSEDDGPVIWPMPYKVSEDIATSMVDGTTGEVLTVDDPEEGFDITFHKEGSGKRTRYSGVAIARQSSSLTRDVDRGNLWIDHIGRYPLPGIVKFFDYDYIKSVFAGTKTRESPEDEASGSQVRDRASSGRRDRVRLNDKGKQEEPSQEPIQEPREDPKPQEGQPSQEQELSALERLRRQMKDREVKG
jgi:hypothetical protein